MDDKDLFSYDNSGNLEETGEESFDLNSFSSHIEKEPVKGKKGRKKKIQALSKTGFACILKRVCPA